MICMNNNNVVVVVVVGGGGGGGGVVVEGSKTLFCPSKFPCARDRISSKFTIWAHALKKVR